MTIMKCDRCGAVIENEDPYTVEFARGKWTDDCRELLAQHELCLPCYALVREEASPDWKNPDD